MFLFFLKSAAKKKTQDDLEEDGNKDEYRDGTGRLVLLAYGMLMVMSGPLSNLNHNLSVASKSQACGSSLAFNQSQQLFDMATAPLSTVLDSVENVLDSMKEIVSEVEASFEAIADSINAVGKVGSSIFIADTINGIGDGVQEAIDWMYSIVDKCNERMGAPETMCRVKFDNAEKDCEKKLKGNILISWSCSIVGLVKHICKVAGGKLTFPQTHNSQCNYYVTGCTVVLEELEQQFYVDFDLTHNFTVNTDVSKTVSEITEGITQEIGRRTHVFRLILTWASRALALTIIWLFLKAHLYRRKYLVKDRYDNCYVTSLFIEMDDKRASMNKETLLPLKREERSKYIRPFSMKLAKLEKFSMVTGLLMWFSQSLWVALIICADYGAYWLLNMIHVNSALITRLNSPHIVRMKVQGEGLMADLYREVINSFDPMSGKNSSIDTTRCLPNPEPPDMTSYRTIGSIYGICLFLVLTEAYGLRLRHVVASYYYPERERQRIAWLYGHIQKRRGGFLRLLRRKVRRNSKSIKPMEKIKMLDRLAAMSPLFEKILKMCGIEKKYCIGCSQSGDKDDTENFKHCAKPDCKGIYCLECFSDLNNMCTLCMKPIDYGDFSDISEEKDSSDEELNLVKGGGKRGYERVSFTDGDARSIDSSSESDFYDE
ncbi:DC-STAMP domain-containing protein 2-like [Glandiceps talaboti]